MTVKNPIKSIVMGPAQNEDNKNYVLLYTITEAVIGKDIGYCRKIIRDVRDYYLRKEIIMPKEIFLKISELEAIAINLEAELLSYD